MPTGATWVFNVHHARFAPPPRSLAALTAAFWESSPVLPDEPLMARTEPLDATCRIPCADSQRNPRIPLRVPHFPRPYRELRKSSRVIHQSQTCSRDIDNCIIHSTVSPQRRATLPKHRTSRQAHQASLDRLLESHQLDNHGRHPSCTTSSYIFFPHRILQNRPPDASEVNGVTIRTTSQQVLPATFQLALHPRPDSLKVQPSQA